MFETKDSVHPYLNKIQQKQPKKGIIMGFLSFKNKVGQVFYLITVLALLWAGSAQAAGVESQARNTGYFNQLHFDGAYTIFLSQGDSCSVKVEAEPKTLAKVTTEVKNGTLKVDTKDHGWFCFGCHRNKDVTIYIKVKDLKSIEIDGSADVNGKGKIVCDTLELSISGSGNINLDTESKALETSIAGSGDMELSGKTKAFNADVAGSGDVKAFDLTADKCKVSIAGSGDCQVNAVLELGISIAGSGDVAYKGNPAKVRNSVSGSGEVTKAE
jgi:hypothetical protein